MDRGTALWATGGDNDFLDILHNLNSFEQILHYTQSNQGQRAPNSEVSTVHFRAHALIHSVRLFFHLLLVSSRHADLVLTFVWPHLEISAREICCHHPDTMGVDGILSAAFTAMKNYIKKYPTAASLPKIAEIIHRTRCQQFSLELLSSKEIFSIKSC